MHYRNVKTKSGNIQDDVALNLTSEIERSIFWHADCVLDATRRPG